MAANDQPIQSVWTRPPRQGREKPALSRAQIVAEAVRLLDADGLDALSMRRLGTRLGAGATSLYWHVGSKDELLELVVDEVYGELGASTPGDPADWRAAAAGCAHEVRAMIHRHPWVGSLPAEVGMTHLGPNVMRLSDRIIGVFEDGGFTLADADLAATTLLGFVIGVAGSEAAWMVMIARAGDTEQNWVTRLWPAAEQAAQAYPRLRALYALRRDEDQAESRENNFTFGLDRILDGLATRLDRR